MPAKSKLGRGVKAVRKGPKGGPAEEVTNLDISLIDPNPQQPREVFDKDALAALEASIGTDGILQPIVVTPAGDRYHVVVGERRLRAATNAGRRLIPAIVRKVPKNRMLQLSLVENIQREDLNPIERARAYKGLLEEHGITQEVASQRLGIARATIANFIRLLDLTGEVQEHVSRGTLSMGHARALLAIKDPVRQVKAAEKVVANGLSVRQTEALTAPPVPKKKPPQQLLSPELQAVVDSLREALGTKVTLQGNATKGKITLEYYSREDLERIIEKIAPFNV
jgi:ParB family chromosome partitioning protein